MSKLLKVKEYAKRAGLGRTESYESLRHLPADAVIRIGHRIRIDWELARRALSGRHVKGTSSAGEADT